MKQIFVLIMVLVSGLSFSCATMGTAQKEQVVADQVQVKEEPELTEVQQEWKRYNYLKSQVFVTNDEYREMLILAKSLAEAGEHVCSWGIGPIFEQTTPGRLFDLISAMDKYSIFYTAILTSEMMAPINGNLVAMEDVEKAVVDYARRKGGTAEGQTALVSFFMNLSNSMNVQSVIFEDIMKYYEVPDSRRSNMIYLVFTARTKLTEDDIDMLKTEFSRLMKVDIGKARNYLRSSLERQWGIFKRYQRQGDELVSSAVVWDDPGYVAEKNAMYTSLHGQIWQTLHNKVYDYKEFNDNQYLQWACRYVESLECRGYQRYIESHM
jgi:hypothetical protein